MDAYCCLATTLKLMWSFKRFIMVNHLLSKVKKQE